MFTKKDGALQVIFAGFFSGISIVITRRYNFIDFYHTYKGAWNKGVSLPDKFYTIFFKITSLARSEM